MFASAGAPNSRGSKLKPRDHRLTRKILEVPLTPKILERKSGLIVVQLLSLIGVKSGIESLKVSQFQAQLEGKVSYVIPLTLFLYNIYLISEISYVKPKLSGKMTGSSAVV